MTLSSEVEHQLGGGISMSESRFPFSIPEGADPQHVRELLISYGQESMDADRERKRYLEVMYGRESVDEQPLLSAFRVAQLDLFGSNKNPEGPWDSEAHKVGYGNKRIIDHVPLLVPAGYNLLDNGDPEMEGRLALVESGYHTMVYGPLGDLYARHALELLGRMGHDRSASPITSELFGGTGSFTASLIRQGHRVVECVDLDPIMLEVAKHNLHALDIANGINWRAEDAMKVMNRRAKSGRRVDLIATDPPWPGNRVHAPSKPWFSLYDMEPNGLLVAKLGLQAADMVAMKVRADIDLNEVHEASYHLHAGVAVLEGELPVSAYRTLREKMLFFFNQKHFGSGIISEEKVELPSLV